MSHRTAAATGSLNCTIRGRAGHGGPLIRAVVLAAVGTALVLGAPSALHAQAGDGWVGKRVVERYRGFRLRLEDQVIDPKMINIYRVERVNGAWLWLKAEGVSLSGWAPADQVIPVEQAIEFFTDHIRANPGDPHGYTMRAIIQREEKKEHDIALGDLNEAIRVAPTSAASYNNRGVARERKKEYDRAIADFDEAIRLDPKSALAYTNRGLAREAKGEYDRALADFDEAIRLDPKSADACNVRAWVWATCPDAKYRDGTRAIESATRACELSGWKDANHIDTLAAAYAEAGEFEAAAKRQSQANALFTDARDKAEGQERLKLYRENKPYRRTNP
jgi:tetratricopeptide (TPR) repeat protein